MRGVGDGMKPLLIERERCRPCGMKLCLTEAEAEFLAQQDGSNLVPYFCPVNHGWHVAREDDGRLRDGLLNYED